MSPTKSTHGAAPVTAKASGVMPRFAARCEPLVFLTLTVLVALRPLIAETYDSGGGVIHPSVTQLADPTPFRTAVFDGVIVVASAAALAWSGWRWRTSPRSGLELGWVLLLIAGVVSSTMAGNKRLAILATIDWLCLPLLTLGLVQILTTPARRRIMIAAILASSLVQAAASYEQAFVGFDETIRHYEENRIAFWEAQRVPLDSPKVEAFESRMKAREASGTFAHSAVAGSHFSLAALAALGVSIGMWRRFRQTRDMGAGAAALASFALTLVLCGALVLTKSRGAMVACAIAGACWLAAHATRGWWTTRRRVVWIGGWVVFAVGALAVVGHGLYHGSLPGASLTFRWQYWTASAAMVADHPIAGVGRENFGRHYLKYKSIESPEEVANPHNLLVQSAAEWGLPGLTAIVLMMLGASRAVVVRGVNRSTGSASTEPQDSSSKGFSSEPRASARAIDPLPEPRASARADAQPASPSESSADRREGSEVPPSSETSRGLKPAARKSQNLDPSRHTHGPFLPSENQSKQSRDREGAVRATRRTWLALGTVGIVVLAFRAGLLGSTDANYIYYTTMVAAMGWIAGALVFGTGAVVLGTGAAPADDRRDDSLHAAIAWGLFAFVLHDMIHFAAFVPATATTFFALLAVVIAEATCRFDPGEAGSVSPSTSFQRRAAGFSPRGALTVSRAVTPISISTLVVLWLGTMHGSVRSLDRARSEAASPLTPSRLELVSTQFGFAESSARFDPTSCMEHVSWLLNVARDKRHAEWALNEANAPAACAIARDPHNVAVRRMVAALRLLQARQAVAVEGRARTVGPAQPLVAAYQRAVDAAREAVALYPLDPPGLVSLADTLAEAGRAAREADAEKSLSWLMAAASEYQRALDLDDARPAWERQRRMRPTERDDVTRKLAEVEELLVQRK